MASSNDKSNIEHPTHTRPSRQPVWEGIAGTTGGSFFRAPSWVDQSKPPGTTSQAPILKDNPRWVELLSGLFIVYSPNIVWLIIALAVYFCFPYNFQIATKWDADFGDWIAKRAVLNLIIVFAYDGFWHIALYRLGWGKRPFNPSRQYRVGKVIHNAYYSALGALQWTLWEALFVYSYATGRLPYLSDKEAFATPWGLAQFAAWFAIVPLFRELHFYFAHRLIHIRALYRYIHSLHHRNTDVEPFSGLCMHPIEHLFYFTSVAPALYFHATPFGFLWNGIHLIISPGASHSGYEDHWQSDQYHYLHHRYMEANYGTPTFMLDHLFGTFRDKMADKSDTYRGEGEGVGAITAKVHDNKATLVGGLPDWDQFIFNVLFCVVTPMILLEALLAEKWEPDNARTVAAVVAVGPIAGAIILLFLTSSARRRWQQQGGLRRELSYPFHKERMVGSLGFHVVAGFLLTCVPVYHTVHMALADPGGSAYFSLRRIIPHHFG